MKHFDTWRLDIVLIRLDKWFLDYFASESIKKIFKTIYHTNNWYCAKMLIPSSPNIFQVEKCANTLKLKNIRAKNLLIPSSQRYPRRQNVLIPSFCILLILQTTTSRQFPNQTLPWQVVPRRTFPRPTSSLTK